MQKSLHKPQHDTKIKIHNKTTQKVKAKSNTDPFKNGGELYQLKTFSTLKTQRICDKVRGLKSCIDVLFIVSFYFYVILCGILTLYSFL